MGNMCEEFYYDDIELQNYSADGDLLIPIGVSERGVYNLRFSCNFHHISEAVSSYLLLGRNGCATRHFFRNVLLIGSKIYSPSEVEFWIMDDKRWQLLSEFTPDNFPHTAKYFLSPNPYFVELNAAAELFNFLRQLEKISVERQTLIDNAQMSVPQINIKTIDEYNKAIDKGKIKGKKLKKIIALTMNTDDFFAGADALCYKALSESDNYGFKNAKAVKRLIHAAMYGIYFIIGTGGRFFGELFGVYADIDNYIFTYECGKQDILKTPLKDKLTENEIDALDSEQVIFSTRHSFLSNTEKESGYHDPSECREPKVVNLMGCCYNKEFASYIDEIKMFYKNYKN